MFTKLRAENILSLKCIDIELGKVNVFIGPNASGKSNIVRALQLLANHARSGLPVLDGYKELRSLSFSFNPVVGVFLSLEALIERTKCTFFLKLTNEFYVEKIAVNDKIIVEIFERWEIDIKNIPLFGLHNYKNVMAALSIAQIIKCPFSSTIKAISSFKGLPHRLEWVSSLNGVNFYNDSKATNVGATIAALESLSKPIVLIAGGLGKGQKFDPLRPLVTKKVKALVLIGTSAEDIEKALKGTTMIFKAKDLEEAVKKAFSLAKPNANVLLSPACASFDMFFDYQERGEEFKKIVHAL